MSRTSQGSDGESPTLAELLLAHEHSADTGLLFEEQQWSWAEYIDECHRYAGLLRELTADADPPHIGVLLDNLPEFAFLLGGAAFGGVVLVGLNPNRSARALAEDVDKSDCAAIVTESRHLSLLSDQPLPPSRVHQVDSNPWTRAVARSAPMSLPGAAEDLFMLVFTSGTAGSPKAVRCTHRKFAAAGVTLRGKLGLTPEDVAYVPMPLFHSNALIAGWSIALASGAAFALRRTFSANEFVHDLHRFGATYTNYVGKPLSYVLSTPEQPSDDRTPLRIAYGNEGSPRDIARFAERFGCSVVDGYGSTEGGIAVGRTPDTPPNALGPLPDGVAVVDPSTGSPCPAAQFDREGRLHNPDEAIGELVNTAGAGTFEGYYRDPDAEAERVRDGRYFSGDLAYRDDGGFCYFAGRSSEWMRVDGENMATVPVERALLRHPAIADVAVYAVPDTRTGDQIMAAVVPEPGAELDVPALGEFLAEQGELGPKQYPRFVRILAELPRTDTFKVSKQPLMRQRWSTSDPVWWRPQRWARESSPNAQSSAAAAGGRTRTGGSAEPTHPHYERLDPEHSAVLDAAVDSGTDSP